ncbi:hypothetical protein GSI_07619 [Ganoderma sinense ZZ0214-1]|uniref:Uncharacterized protein n=1 Tax=Ganoderma sinense ZZ0214-1 TaxID=1077348 RepID=A0A2G8RMF4_9APHY|nr:hypothetical protein GSI_15390 [Ganoderma sinense ZZ0214-1]PIL30432.1 hypothetical protein GSI_07619 [Ganoderma sinense ZZ0214-1]
MKGGRGRHHRGRRGGREAAVGRRVWVVSDAVPDRPKGSPVIVERVFEKRVDVAAGPVCEGVSVDLRVKADLMAQRDEGEDVEREGTLVGVEEEAVGGTLAVRDGPARETELGGDRGVAPSEVGDAMEAVRKEWREVVGVPVCGIRRAVVERERRRVEMEEGKDDGEGVEVVEVCGAKEAPIVAGAFEKNVVAVLEGATGVVGARTGSGLGSPGAEFGTVGTDGGVPGDDAHQAREGGDGQVAEPPDDGPGIGGVVAAGV